MIFNRCLCHGYVENYASMWTIWKMMCEDPVHYHGQSHFLVDAVERSGRSQDSGILKTLTCFSNLSFSVDTSEQVGTGTGKGDTEDTNMTSSASYANVDVELERSGRSKFLVL